MIRAHSIRHKFLFILMLMTIISTSVTGIVLVYYESINANVYHQDKLKLISSVLSPSLTAAVVFGDTTTVDELINPTVNTEGVIAAFVYDENDNFLSRSFKDNNDLIPLNDLEKLVTPLVMEGNKAGSLVLYSDNSVVKSKNDFYKRFVSQILIAIFITSFICAWLLSRYITKPLSKLIAVADKVTTSNNYAIRTEKTTTDEIGDLTDCFNSMLETIQYRDSMLESKVIARTRELEIANRKLHHQANEDALSGLPNRRSLLTKLKTLTEEQSAFCLLFIDLDGFKAVNDSLGHDYGDILLKSVSERLIHCVRKNDFVARLGGDEFTIILKDITAKSRINGICDDILTSLSESFSIKNKDVFITGSVGITLYPEDSTSVENLVNNADQAMYESKQQGKNCYSYFNQDVRNRLAERRVLVDELKGALIRQEFEIHYQPILSLRTESICKAEALIRWRHPTKGLLFPNDFLSTMEEEGLMDELGYWIASQATSDAMYWMNSFSESVQVSINISPSQFCENYGKLRQWLDNLIADKVDTKQIVIEITEHSFMENSTHASKILEDMRALGIEIAVDDFGVGYSSFSYLQQLDLDILKIDKSFVSNLTTKGNGFKLCKAIIGVAHQLGLTVIAEGIETNEQKRMLIRAGCDLGQGYLFSKPIPVSLFEQQFLTSNASEQANVITSQPQKTK